MTQAQQRIAVLLSELQGDPLGIGYLQHWPDEPGVIVEKLSAENIEAHGRVERADFAIWCAGTGMRGVIQDHADDKASPLRAIALTLIDFLRGSAGAIDFSIQGNVQSLQAFVSAGGCTQQQAEELLAISATFVSRAEQLGLAPVFETDIREALE